MRNEKHFWTVYIWEGDNDKFRRCLTALPYGFFFVNPRQSLLGTVKSPKTMTSDVEWFDSIESIILERKWRVPWKNAYWAYKHNR